MTKDLFLKDKKLASEWRGIAGGTDFEKVLTYARSIIVEQAPTREELRGVELLAHTLLTMSEPEDKQFEWPNPGLIHQIEAMPEKPTEKPKKRK